MKHSVELTPYRAILESASSVLLVLSSHAVRHFGNRGCSREILRKDVMKFTYYLRHINLLLRVQGLLHPLQFPLLELDLLQSYIPSMEFKFWMTGDPKSNFLLPTVNDSSSYALIDFRKCPTSPCPRQRQTLSPL